MNSAGKWSAWENHFPTTILYDYVVSVKNKTKTISPDTNKNNLLLVCLYAAHF